MQIVDTVCLWMGVLMFMLAFVPEEWKGKR